MATQDEKARASSIEQANLPTLRSHAVPDILEDVDFIMEHLNDPNFDLKHGHKEPDPRPSDGDAESRKTASDFDDDSPYPEVRAAVASVDDPNMPVNTFRMWCLGIFFSLIVSGLNTFFGLRYPAVFITGIVVQLISLPLGHGLARILPRGKFNILGYRWSLNPGPFTIKEHVCITVMASVSVSGAYSTEIVLTQRIFYGQITPLSYQILLAVGSQVLGFSVGGLLRQFVVWPASMIWPAALVNSALFNTLHNKRDHGHISRGHFFVYVGIGTFVWHWFPEYIFTGLSYFNWVCWIAPNNPVVNILFGSITGLGMSIITLNWGMVSAVGSPLATPWWSQVNTGVAFVIVYWLIVPILYFTNVWDTAYFPISSLLAFDNTGNFYEVTKVITNGIFDPVKYASYSRIYLPLTIVIEIGLHCAALPAACVHTFLWFRRDIVRRFRSSLRDEPDLHSRLMLAYPEVPWWWFTIIGVIAFTFFCTAIEIFPIHLPIWAAFVGFFIASAVSLPLAMLQAVTNQLIMTNVMLEMIAGYMLPGRPIANIAFKTLGFITSFQAISFAGDLKLGHYMKIAPRVMFSIQIVATVIAAITATLTQVWMLDNIVDICSLTQPQGFVCPGSNIFATASIVWGAIGPRRLFSPDAPYSAVLWFFVIGIFAPIPFYFLARRFPLSFYRYINVPIFFTGIIGIPPASGINYTSWLLWGFVFNFVIRRLHFRWWMRYNYTLSAALDSGYAIAVLVIFFALGLPKLGGIQFDWWGNSVSLKTLDGQAVGFKPLPESGVIGPSTWL